jgi:NUMOD4 motif/HNH endonuclease
LVELEEIWAKIPGYDYEASNLGRIRSMDRWITFKCGKNAGRRRLFPGKVLAQFTLWNGYKTTHLGSYHPNKYVHILVARAFLGEPPEGMETCHEDDVKANCKLSNLRYDTRQGNMADRKRNGAQNPV